MPVFVEWKWIERTKTLLTIFHFHDDFSKPNLRLMKYEKHRPTLVPHTRKFLAVKKAWMTWAPSHPELGLLMQLLSYANIINGLKENEKRKLRIDLEGRRTVYEHGVRNEDRLKGMVRPNDVLNKIRKEKKAVIYEPDSGMLQLCVELCPEYIDFIKKLMKPYLKD